MQNPTPAFSHTFEGQVWQVLTDASQNLLVAEIRNSNRTVSFSALDLAARQWLWHGFLLPEHWWSSAALARDGVLFVQGLSGGQHPDPRGITALDIRTCQVCWADPAARFERPAGGGAVVVRHASGDDQNLLLRNGKTGIALRGTGPEPEHEPPGELSGSAFRFPAHYPQDSPHSASIADFLMRNLGISPQLTFDYAENEHFVVISYYIRADEQMQNRLVVFDTRSGLPVLHQTLASRCAGIGKDTFFIFNNLLVFVSEQTTIVCHELQQTQL